MSFSVNTNVASLSAQNYLRINTNFQSQTINRVTSGLRIVQSGDDAAGLAIANGYRSDQATLTQGIRNANDGMSQMQILDGGLNNIAKLLDRARTLATESATGTFTGDRGVLNDEFQSVLGEIDRQAQAIGLNTNGIFAKSLSVFIGGGKTSGNTTALQNGAVTVDLTNSTVDAQSLGLKGVQALSHASVDATSLAAIFGNGTNQKSLAAQGTATFILKGPGFDAGVPISVKTSGVTGSTDLVNAINAAIDSAASGGSSQATALQNAQIKSSVTTTPSGTQTLAFSSNNAAFQVQAGDRVSNALLGNMEQNAVLTGDAANQGATVDTSVNHTLHFVFDGDNTAAGSFDVNLPQGTQTSKGDIVNTLNADTSFNKRGVAYLDGNQIVVKSLENSPASSVAITSPDFTAAAAGFPGGTNSAAAAQSSTGADLSTWVMGAAPSGSNAITSFDQNPTATIAGDSLDVTVGGVTQTVTWTAFSGTKQQLANMLNGLIATQGGGALAGKAAASVDARNRLVLKATDPTQTFMAGNTGMTTLSLFGINPNTFQTAENITVRFAGGGLSGPVDVPLTAVPAGTSVDSVLADLKAKVAGNPALAGAGITVTTSTTGNNIVFTSARGQPFTVTASGDVEGKLGLGSFQADAASSVDYSTITATRPYSLTTGSGTSAKGATLEVSIAGGAAAKLGVDLTAGDATSGSLAGNQNVLPDTGAPLAGGTVVVAVDGVSHTVTLTPTQMTASEILTAFGTLGGSAAVTIDPSGFLHIASNSKGADSSVQILNAGTAPQSDIDKLGLGLLGAAPATGHNATIDNVIAQLSMDITQDPVLSQAGLQAGKDAAGARIVISSSNGTRFQLNSYGADLGFGTAGAPDTSGNTTGPAPQTPPAIDSGGAHATPPLAFQGIACGPDTQTLTVTTAGANGGQSAGIVLNNTNARGIDEALSTINAGLQKSAGALQNVVAVKDESNGAQSIVFLSTDPGFQVSVGNTASGAGVTPPAGNTVTAAALPGGGLTSILDPASAQSAVSALATAVGLLGNAQAVVGRGENTFSYATDLAQSQMTNLATAESRIRDADLAAEAANLTKAQILIQAGVAALAQANSAPQQVLSLLK